MPKTNDLRARLANEILAYMQEEELGPGTHLPEPEFCERFKVSRTPIRAALNVLCEQGMLEHRPKRGFFTLKAADNLPETVLPEPDEERLYLQIAEDRIARKLPMQISEADLLRRYDVAKSVLRRVLQRLLHEGLIERLPGRGWSFVPVLDSKEAHDESYRFRLAVEPLALLEPGYQPDTEELRACKDEHARVLGGQVKEITPVELFEMNARFHELLASGSGNRFFLQAVRQQNRLRRFVNYHWTYGAARVIQTCREHMAVLEALEEGDAVWASSLLRRHLEISSAVSPYDRNDDAGAAPRVIRLG